VALWCDYKMAVPIRAESDGFRAGRGSVSCATSREVRFPCSRIYEFNVTGFN